MIQAVNKSASTLNTVNRDVNVIIATKNKSDVITKTVNISVNPIIAPSSATMDGNAAIIAADNGENACANLYAKGVIDVNVPPSV